MFDQPRNEPLEANDFFADGMSARRPVQGTVARGDLREDATLYTGTDAHGGFAAASPIPVDRTLLHRGKERYEIFCSPCHSRVGDGQGMIVARGYAKPPSFHTDRLRSQPLGYFVDVIAHGFGQMPGYASQIPAADRWAIAAYIGALQLSQHAPLADLPLEDVAEIERARSDAPQNEPKSGAHE